MDSKNLVLVLALSGLTGFAALHLEVGMMNDCLQLPA